MAVLLITDPSGARLPWGKVTVEVMPRGARALRVHDDGGRVDAISFLEYGPQPGPALRCFPPVEHAAERVTRKP